MLDLTIFEKFGKMKTNFLISYFNVKQFGNFIQNIPIPFESDMSLSLEFLNLFFLIYQLISTALILPLLT